MVAVLLSGTPRVRIAPGTPNPRKHYVFGGLLFVFLFKPVRSIHIQKCIDYDAVSGLMYSVSTSAPDLDGFDIGAAADWLYMPARGKTEPFPMEDALALLTDSTGYAGSAGGSLKGAIAAERTLAFAVEQTPLSWNRQTMYTAFVDAFMALDADKKEEFSGNLENIEWLINTAFDDYETVADLFEDSVPLRTWLRSFPILTPEPSGMHWTASSRIWYNGRQNDTITQEDKMWMAKTGMSQK